MTSEIQIMVWDRHRYVVGLIGCNPPLDNWIANNNSYFNKIKTCPVRFNSKRAHAITKMNDNTSMGNTRAG
jgi:hypothetical protein